MCTHDLADENVVEPVRGSGEGSAECAHVHGEDFRLVDPGDWAERPTESDREEEYASNTSNTRGTVVVSRSVAGRTIVWLRRSSFPRHGHSAHDGADDERPATAEPVHDEGDEDKGADDTPSARDTGNEEKSVALETHHGIDGRTVLLAPWIATARTQSSC